ncbi:hypothetical protein B0H21DRAFT_300205 [Amylocystis lapponica]|nr:hypothetical protein B0H21DRAFT_300205 [Amylocystis lapponica]
MPTIPPEMCDYVINFLHDDTRALGACSLTCRAWVPATQVHLFRNISLDNSKLFTAFCRLLHTAPHLGYHVRELSIARTSVAVNCDVNDPEAGLNLCSILTHLSGIQTLGFYLTHLPSVPTLGFYVPLTELTLVACRFPAFDDFIDLFYSFPQLEHLHLVTVTWQTRSLDLRPRSAAPKLRKLTIGRDSDICLLVEWLLAEALCSKIDSISVRCATKLEAIAVGALLEVLGSSLKDLTLDWYLPTANVLVLPLELSVAPCIRLCGLTLHCAIPYSYSIPWITSALSELNSSTLETSRCRYDCWEVWMGLIGKPGNDIDRAEIQPC